MSAFVGHGKKTAWATWNSFPELTDALLELAHAPTEIPEQSMLVIERFVILIYDRTSTCTNVNKARKKLFAKTSSVKRIPPSHAALEQHVKRAAFQGGHVWGKALTPHPSASFSNQLGLGHDRWWTVRTTLDHTSRSVKDLL